MKLTCVTAVYNALRAGNRERLIRCVESVAKLKTEHEHLIYDGASTDGTVELLRELEEKTPGLKVVSEPDTGIYNALNKGVRDAKGEWFYVLGADDYICDPIVMDRLMVEVASTVELIIAPVKRDVERNFYLTPRDLHKILVTFAYSHQSVIMKTSLLRALGGFNEEYKFCADWDMLFKCHIGARKFWYTTAPFAFYAAGGVSEQEGVGNDDFDIIYKKLYEMDDAHYRRFRETNIPGWKIVFKYAFHADYALRSSARWYAHVKLNDFKQSLMSSVKSICRRLVYKR